MHIGHRRESGGREGAGASQKLSGALERLGFELRRLKTGTPPRLRRDSIDFACLEQQPGDRDPRPFSFRTRAFSPDQVVCHLTHTGEDTHALIRENLVRSPLYAGIIEGRGPRYCPSVEDKVVRFADKPRHLVFLEPEGRNSEEIYVNGLATSLPADVQEGVVRSMRGLERAVLSRYGYAVEYDSVPSYQVSRTMESKPVSGLYLAGQIIGTSGYEEAAAQGLVAGINAGLSLNDQQPLIFDRSEAYLGVLVDDLVTKDITEPYRMFTSRAEHRLALRCDNAGERLLPHAARIGLLPGAALARLSARVEIAREVRALLENRPGRAPDGRSMPVSELLLRPGVTLRGLLEDDARKDGLGETVGRLLRVDPGDPAADRTAREILEQVENDLKYAGYIAKQDKVLRRQAHLDDLELPRDLDYAAQGALSLEAREKLDRMRPATLAEASRIDGVRAGDLAVLTVLVRRRQGEAWNEAGER